MGADTGGDFKKAFFFLKRNFVAFALELCNN